MSNNMCVCTFIIPYIFNNCLERILILICTTYTIYTCIMNINYLNHYLIIMVTYPIINKN